MGYMRRRSELFLPPRELLTFASLTFSAICDTVPSFSCHCLKAGRPFRFLSGRL